MSDRALRRLAVALFAVPLLCVPVSVGLVAATGAPWTQDVADSALLVPAFYGIGLLVVNAEPRSRIGWLLVTIGFLVGLNALTSALAAWDTTREDAFRGAALNVLVLGTIQVTALGVLIPRVLLLFPDGAPPTPRWRVVGWAQAVVLATILLGLFVPGPIEAYQGEYAREYQNPLGIGPLDTAAVDVLNVVASTLFVFGALGAVVSIVVRFRRSAGVERLQLKWVAWGVGAMGLCFVASGVLGAFGIEALSPFLSLALCLFPLTVGIAILRYRLFEIDRLISKTLAYAALTVVLGAGYAGLVLAGQAVFSSVAGGGDLVIAVSTLLVAALFLPARARVQRFVDRRFYRRRYDAARTLEAFGARLREHVDLETLRADLGTAVHETLQPEHASLWLSAGGRR